MTAVALLEQHTPELTAAGGFTAAVLEAIVSATWPDGSPLVEVAPEVLQARLAPAILDSATALVASLAGGAR